MVVWWMSGRRKKEVTEWLHWIAHSDLSQVPWICSTAKTLNWPPFCTTLHFLIYSQNRIKRIKPIFRSLGGCVNPTSSASFMELSFVTEMLKKLTSVAWFRIQGRLLLRTEITQPQTNFLAISVNVQICIELQNRGNFFGISGMKGYIDLKISARSGDPRLRLFLPSSSIFRLSISLALRPPGNRFKKRSLVEFNRPQMIVLGIHTTRSNSYFLKQVWRWHKIDYWLHTYQWATLQKHENNDKYRENLKCLFQLDSEWW